MAKSLNATSDNNTQAMTEVALGLSMAFFSLLVLALLSISAGNDLASLSNSSVNDIAELSDGDHALDALSEQNRLSLAQAEPSQNQQDSDAAEALSLTTFIFYYQGQYFDVNFQAQNLQTVNPDKATVVAVMPTLSFTEVMQVHKDFQDNDIQITAMDENWQRAFAGRIDTLALSKRF